jgi:putative SOS response-associated peptidase YedK
LSDPQNRHEAPHRKTFTRNLPQVELFAACLSSFLTTDAKATVKPVHAEAMPAILTTLDELDRWMTAPAAEALQLQRPLPDEALQSAPMRRRHVADVGNSSAELFPFVPANAEDNVVVGV